MSLSAFYGPPASWWRTLQSLRPCLWAGCTVLGLHIYVSGYWGSHWEVVCSDWQTLWYLPGRDIRFFMEWEERADYPLWPRVCYSGMRKVSETVGYFSHWFELLPSARHDDTDQDGGGHDKAEEVCLFYSQPLTLPAKFSQRRQDQVPRFVRDVGSVSPSRVRCSPYFGSASWIRVHSPWTSKTLS